MKYFAAPGGELSHLVSSVGLVCVVRRTRETRQPRRPLALLPSAIGHSHFSLPPPLTQGSHIVTGVMDTSTTLQ